MQPELDIEASVEAYPFPPIDGLMPDGLVAFGGDLEAGRLISAYAQGIFPWYSEPPIKWFSPDPRLVLSPSQIKVGKSLGKVIRSDRFSVTVDTAFPQVIEQCAELREFEGTWITNDMQRAYGRLHEIGVAHSVESWSEGELVGGLYGVSLGRMFFGESMFYTKPDASKVALVALAKQLVDWEFDLIDCQVETGHLRRLGAEFMARADFLAMLDDSLRHETRVGSWHF